MKEFKLIITLLVVFLGSVFAQDNIDNLSAKKLKSFGRNAVRQGDYFSAIDYFERYCEVHPGNTSIEMELADCYRISRDYVKAQQWYDKAYRTNPEKNHKGLFYMGLMQKSNSDYKSAKENLLKFKKEYKGDDARIYKKQVDAEVAGADAAIEWLKEPKKLIVSHLHTTINKAHVELSPFILDSTTLIYAALSADPLKKYLVQDSASFPVRQFYTAKQSGEQWKGTGTWTAPFNEPGVNTANGTFSLDKTKFFFTKCKPNWQNKMICSIYMSVLENGTWQTPVLLNKEINNPKYTSTQPAIGVESKKNQEVLYFVSNRPKGKGETDIWYSIYDAKKKTFKAPRNAGAKINTAGQEVTPFIDPETKTLYFSSTGWPGMGGLDIFKVNGELNKWTTPNNITAPMNSPADELYFVTKRSNDDGFFVSNRKGGIAYKNETCCDDIYYYKWAEDLRFEFKGVAIADSLKNIPLKGARVDLMIEDDSTKELINVGTFTADEAGKFNVPLEYGNQYKLMISNPGYLNESIAVSTKDKPTDAALSKTTYLTPVPEESIALKNIYYETNKSDLLAPAKASIDSTLLKLLNDNPSLIIEISSHTDNVGSDAYNMNLSQARAESVAKYLASKGIARERLKSKGYGESKPIAPNANPDGTDNPVGREKNRRTEFKVIGKLNEKVQEIEE